MRILGIHGWKDRSHDAAACLVENGRLICMAEEERFIRQKYAYGAMPVHSAAFCLQRAGITLDDVDIVAWGWDYEAHYKLRGMPWSKNDTVTLELLFPKRYFPRTRDPKLEMIPHHLAHAASAFYASPFPKAAILVVDGQGETASTTLACGEENSIRIIRQFPIDQSLGYFYEAVCKHIGFRSHDAGKTMGLAAYGKNSLNDNFLELDTKGYRFGISNLDSLADLMQHDEQAAVMRLWEPILHQLIGNPNQVTYRYNPEHSRFQPEPVLEDSHKNLAALAQSVVEMVTNHLARLLTVQCDTRNICIAGGVGLNCVANGLLVTKGVVDQIYVQPAAGDAGTCLGAALVVAHQAGELKREHMRDAYWGPDFSDKEVEVVLLENGLKYEQPSDIAEAAAELIAKGKLVGWFQGKMEIGPRALGNRSILADPHSKQIADKVNVVKGREAWRPLAPSVLDERRQEYFTVDYPSPHMLLSFDVRPECRSIVPGVVHVDGSTRPQTVTSEQNPTYYRLLKAFESMTGTGLVLNTSFNLAGEPIVCTPVDALRSFFTSGLDALAMGSYLVTK